MAGFQYKFFPTDFFVPVQYTATVDADPRLNSPKLVPVRKVDTPNEEAAELPKAVGVKTDGGTKSDLSASSSGVAAIQPVHKKKRQGTA